MGATDAETWTGISVFRKKIPGVDYGENDVLINAEKRTACVGEACPAPIIINSMDGPDAVEAFSIAVPALPLCTEHNVEDGVPEPAYCGGVGTWVSLPKELWPASWAGMEDPVCPLILSL